MQATSQSRLDFYKQERKELSDSLNDKCRSELIEQHSIELNILNILIKYDGKIDVIKPSKYNFHWIHRNIVGIKMQRVDEAISFQLCYQLMKIQVRCHVIVPNQAILAETMHILRFILKDIFMYFFSYFSVSTSHFTLIIKLQQVILTEICV
jgi:hypothetical protein